MKRFLLLLPLLFLSCEQEPEGGFVDGLLGQIETIVAAAIPGAGIAVAGLRRALVAQRATEGPSRSKEDVDYLYQRLDRLEGLLLLRGVDAMREPEKPQEPLG